MIKLSYLVPPKVKNALTKFGLINVAKKHYLRFYRSSMEKQFHKFKETGKLPLPDTLIFEPTMKCNLRCRMCYINFDILAKLKHMTLDEIKTIFEKMPSIKKVALIGGEVFLRADFIDMLRYFGTKGIKSVIATNATLLNDDKIEQLSKLDSIDSFVVSIDGAEKIHNQIRGFKHAFGTSIENIRKLRAKGFVVTVVAVITRENLLNLKEIVDEVKKSNANYLELEYERIYTKDMIEKSAEVLGLPIEYFPLVVGESAMPEYEFKTLKINLDEAEKYSKKQKFKISFMPVDLKERLADYYDRKIEGEHFCKQLFVARMDCTGQLVHCFAIRKKFGSVLEKPFEEVWYGDEFMDFRKKLAEGPVAPICETCEKYIKCEN